MDEIFINKIGDIAENINKYNIYYTSFLTEEEQISCTDILRKYKNLNFKFYGGFQNSIRNILSVYDSDFEPLYADFPVSVLYISIPNKNSVSLAHGDYLGSLLGLGLKRKVIGDIIVKDNGAYVALCENMAEYIKLNLDRVGREKCTVSDAENINDIDAANRMTEQVIIITSNRLDCFVSALVRLSRFKSSEFIKQGKVYINNSQTFDTHKKLNTNDIITLRGHGKFLLTEAPENADKTSKGRLKITVNKYN